MYIYLLEVQMGECKRLTIVERIKEIQKSILSIYMLMIHPLYTIAHINFRITIS